MLPQCYQSWCMSICRACIFLFEIKILEYKVLQDRAAEKESWKIEKQALSWQHLAFEGATKNWWLHFLWQVNIKMGLPRWLHSKESTCKAGDVGSIPGSGSYPGEENGYSLQYSCLGKPMDRGTWQATVYGITEESDMAYWLNNSNNNKKMIKGVITNIKKLPMKITL